MFPEREVPEDWGVSGIMFIYEGKGTELACLAS